MPAKTLELRRPLVMVGMMGAGKSAIGAAVAELLGVAFLDSDEEIIRNTNRSICEIFEQDGEAAFRARELATIAQLLQKMPLVLSTGGGAFMQQPVRELIAKRATAVWLQADLDLLWQRVADKNTRPLLMTQDPYATLAAIYKERTPVYALASVHVKAQPEYSIETMAQHVIERLKEADIVKDLTDGAT